MYTPVAKTKTIKATSRVSLKIRDNFYTIEASEEREIPDNPDVDMNLEWSDLWTSVNNVVDEQAEDIYKSFRK